MSIKSLACGALAPAVAIVAAVVAAQPARALLVYDAVNSSATFLHDPDLSDKIDAPPLGPGFVGSGTLTPRSNPKKFVPTTTFPTAPSYQFITKDTKPGTNNFSTAKASFAYVSNPTTLSVKLPSGAGVVQSNQGNVYGGASMLLINFDLFYTADANGLGPGAAGVANFVIGGTVGKSPDAFARFEAVLNFLDETDGGKTLLRSPVHFLDTWQNGDADVNPTTGAFTGVFSSSELFNGTGEIEPGTRVHVNGFIRFGSRDVRQGLLPEPAVPEPLTATLGAMGAMALALGATRRRRLS